MKPCKMGFMVDPLVIWRYSDAEIARKKHPMNSATWSQSSSRPTRWHSTATASLEAFFVTCRRHRVAAAAFTKCKSKTINITRFPMPQKSPDSQIEGWSNLIRNVPLTPPPQPDVDQALAALKARLSAQPDVDPDSDPDSPVVEFSLSPDALDK